MPVGAVGAAVLGGVTARVLVSGERELAASSAALERGEPREAAVRARRAAGWYAPGAPHVRVAYERLIALARAAEDHGQIDLALSAWRGVRSAALEPRWIMVPHRAELELANRQIARLVARPPPGPGVGGASEVSETSGPTRPDAGEELALLARSPGPRTGWILALLGGFVLAAVGFVAAAQRLGADLGRTRWVRLRPALLLVAAGAALWLLALWRA
ncbi:MAG: hypothetical protein HY744_13780 [Deltaproteobacteria bacterium]|nr:hypothetical protein [Deltaproteobacteria bacterium]